MEMATALDAPVERLDLHEQNFVSKVREHGWFCTNVFAEEDSPGFSYSTGFWLDLGYPEIVVFSLDSKVAHSVLWDVYRDVKGGKAFPIDRRIPDLFGNTDAFLFPVAETHFPHYLGWSRWFYGTSGFRCLQLVWPDKSGLFPWEPGADPAFAKSQPDLSEEGWGSCGQA